MRLEKVAKAFACVALATMLTLPAYAGKGGAGGGKNGGGKSTRTSSQHRDRVCSNPSGDYGYMRGTRNVSPTVTPTKAGSGKQARDGSCGSVPQVPSAE